MTQYNLSNVKLSSSQLNQLKYAIKNETEVILNLSWNLIQSSNDETNFSHKLLLTSTKVSKKLFSKTQFSKIGQSGGFIFGPSNMLHSSNESGLLNSPTKRFFFISEFNCKLNKDYGC